MSTVARIRPDDVKRIVKGCIGGGMMVGAVQVLPDGEIRVYASGQEPSPAANPLDRLLRANGA